jgi:hypothetical protein
MSSHWCTYCQGHNTHNCQFNQQIPRVQTYTTNNTATPQRQWVGLNWDDLPDIYVGDIAFLHGAKWAEAKLKQKNGA